ncbi:MAG TPA: winged helix-turn-helix domain-containing protein [Capsulimonadaceae bacterium]|jgi:DNA-binding LacI/PurR family transcriptional regulator
MLTKGRTPVKKEHVAGELRRQIIDGKLRPGERLPTRTALEDTFQTSTATVQSALDDLVRDGFVRVHGRRGTFVKDELPFRTRYAFVFPRDPANHAEWPRFFTAIASEVMRANMASGIELPIYVGVNDKDSEGYRNLAYDIRARRLAGVVFVAECSSMAMGSLIGDVDLPVVSIADIPELTVPKTSFDVESMIDKALDYFLCIGKKSVALLAIDDWLGPYGDHWAEGIRMRGMETRPYWTQTFHYTLSRPARNCANMLARSRTLEVFDALFIADDNIVAAASQGIVDAGSEAVRGLEIVAHCNFPLIDSLPIPLKRIGFDSQMIVSSCIGNINARRSGGKWDSRIEIPALFDHELPNALLNEMTVH